MRDLLSLGRKNLLDFHSDDTGNVAIIVAALFIPLLLAVAGSVELGRYVSVETRLRDATESAALAAASLRSSEDSEKIVDEYIRSNLPDTALWQTVEISVPDPIVTTTSRTIKVTASINLPTSFLKIVGFNELTAQASSVATQTKTDAEIALVLDISSSMKNSDKIDKLKPAAKEFVEEIFNDSLFQEATVSLIPFGGTVNVGSAFFQKWVTNSEDTIENPSIEEYAKGNEIPRHEFTFTNGENCIEYRSEDISDNVIPLASRPQLPNFTRYTYTNPYCPPNSTAMFLNSTNSEEIKSRIDNMKLSDGTGMEVGAMWGLKSLSPRWKGQLGGDAANRPANFDDVKTLKFMILMTDGEITHQSRPKHPRSRSRPRITGGTEQKLLPQGDKNDTPETDSAVGYFKRVCGELRENGVTVFTIGFQIDKGALSEELLKYCATNPGNYYLVDDLDIGSAFDAIFKAISQLRITG